MRGIYSTEYKIFFFKSRYITLINDKILNYFRFSNDGMVRSFVNNWEPQYKNDASYFIQNPNAILCM